MILPLKTKNQPESPPYATFSLIALNIVIYVCTSNGLFIRDSVVEQFALTHANVGPLTLFSSMFLHGDIFHIAGNMWFLWLLGAAVEGRLKTIKFVLLYFLSGLCGDGLHLVMTIGQQDVPSLGASGAIMGLLGAALWMFPHSKMVVGYFFGWWWYGLWEWRMWGVALYYLGFDLLGVVMSSGSDGIAHFAHLGGALGGFLVALAMRVGRDDVVVSDAKSTLTDVGDLRVLSKHELGQMVGSQPNNAELALAWMNRSLQYGSLPGADVTQHFLRHGREIVRNGDIEQVGAAVFNLSQQPGAVPAQLLLDAATRLERESRPQLAKPLLERAISAADCTDAVAESAIFKLGMIEEAWFQNHAKALELFQEHARRWPMSPMDAQVKARIAVLSSRI